jgi:hypothetical protein
MVRWMVLGVLVLGICFAAVDAFARSSSGHWSGAHSFSQTGPTHRPFPHRILPFRRAVILGPAYYQPGYAPADDLAPPPSEHAIAERRRECEPKTYTVPNASGGESQVTIVRC